MCEGDLRPPYLTGATGYLKTAEFISSGSGSLRCTSVPFSVSPSDCFVLLNAPRISVVSPVTRAPDFDTLQLDKPRRDAAGTVSFTNARGTRRQLTPPQLRRKTKQRGYERTYRGRLRLKRQSDRTCWMALEMSLRTILATKRVVDTTEIHLVATIEHGPLQSASVSTLRNKLCELLQQTRALQEQRATLLAAQRQIDAMNLWGGQAKSCRLVRAALNTLPELRGCPTFVGFRW